MNAPSFTFAPAEPAVDPAFYGPDDSVTPPEPPVEEPDTTRRAKGTKSKDSGFLGLGNNDPARSGIRQLTDADCDQLAGMYRWFGRMSKPFRPALGIALIENADACAESWCSLARKNVKVRRALLSMMEGNEWVKLTMAHSPILIAALPEKFVAQMLLRVGNTFGDFFGGPDDSDDMAEAGFVDGYVVDPKNYV